QKRKDLVELKNQANNLLLGYRASLRDNRSFLRNELIDLTNDKARELQAVMDNPNISPANFKVLLEDFQQRLFAIGTDVYTQVNKDEMEIELPTEIPQDSIMSDTGLDL
ncbi:MAG: molecular chaperone DnaK, partial [Dolichospermum sp.]